MIKTPEAQALSAYLEAHLPTYVGELRALLGGYSPRRRWAFAPPDLARTSLDHQQAEALLHTLAVLTPAAPRSLPHSRPPAPRRR